MAKLVSNFSAIRSVVLPGLLGGTILRFRLLCWGRGLTTFFSLR